MHSEMARVRKSTQLYLLSIRLSTNGINYPAFTL